MGQGGALEDMPAERFDIRLSPTIGWLLRGLGMGPKRSGLVLAPPRLQVRAGLFRADIPLSDIVSVRETSAPWWALAGIHTDLRGRWVINGAPGRLVRLDLAQPVRGQMAGVPVRIRRLDVGLSDNAGLIRELASHR
jgi:hypothetical protein